jgi:hypothetical protein
VNFGLPQPPASERIEMRRRPARAPGLHLLLLGALVFLFCWPLLFYGIPKLADDSSQHAEWDKSFSNQIAGGEWYPRWLSASNDGLGAPVFFYYPPMASYASSPFGLLFGARDPNGWLETGFSTFLAVLLSAISAYFWLRSHASGEAAAFGAAIYVIAPYHLAVDLYLRGATAELWGFVWMPLILFAAEALGRRSRWAFPGLAVSYALLIITHLPTIICFSALVPAAAFFLSERKRAVATTLGAVGAMGLGTSLAAIYLVPAMRDQWKTNIQYIVGAVDYRDFWFFRPIAWGLDGPERLAIMSAVTFAYVGILLWVCLRYERDPHGRRVAIFYAGVVVFAFVFMSQLSSPVWRMIKYLRFVQFPTRFGALPPLAAAMMTALAFGYLKDLRPRFVLVSLAILLGTWIGATAWAGGKKVAYEAGRREFAYMATVKSGVKLKTEPCEYLPPSTDLAQTCSDKLDARNRMLRDFLGVQAPQSAFFPAGSADDVSGSAWVLDWKPRRVLLDVNAPEAGALTLRHFYYYGWSAELADTGAPIPIGPSIPDGFLQVGVPQGKHEIIVELRTQPSEKAGRLISLASLACLVGILIFVKIRAPLAG